MSDVNENSENVESTTDHMVEFESDNGTLVTPEELQSQGDQYLKERLAEIKQQFGDSDSESSQAAEEDQTAAKEPEEKEEEAKDDKSEEAESEEKTERAGKSLRRLMAKEKRILEERKKFDEERKDYEEKLAQYDEAKRAASIDPLAFLKSLEISDEQLQDLAKSVYYEALGDDAPEDYKGSRELLQLKKEIASLKAEKTGGKKEEQPEIDVQARYQELVASYEDAVYGVDEGSAAVNQVIEKYGEDAVVQDILQVANQYATQNPNDPNPITSEEALEYLEEVYAEKLGLTKAEPEPEPEQKARAPKTLRNNVSNKSARAEIPDPDKDWEAYKEYCRTRGMSAIEDEYRKGGY